MDPELSVRYVERDVDLREGTEATSKGGTALLRPWNHLFIFYGG